MTLRKALPRDLEFIKDTEMDPENAPYIGHWSTEEYEEALYDKDCSLQIIEEKGTQAGFVLVTGLKDRCNSINLCRIAINRKGTGIGRRALQQLIRQAFSEWGANRLWLDVRTFNRNAQKLYESLGFIHEGTLRQASKMENGYCDIHIYAILKDEFPRLRWMKRTQRD